MSVVFLGPRRVYVMLLFWQRLGDRCDSSSIGLARMGGAVAAAEPSERARAERPSVLVLSARLHRVVWRRLIGLTFLVFDQSGGGL